MTRENGLFQQKLYRYIRVQYLISIRYIRVSAKKKGVPWGNALCVFLD
jgi:hypothetical protein